MALSYGFFNSVNHDRLYDAVDISRIFNYLIKDGVYNTVGGGLLVTKGTAENKLIVATGRAWFNSTWIENNANIDLVNDISAINAPGKRRVDALVLHISKTERNVTLQFVRGEVTTGGSYIYPNIPLDTDAEFYHDLAWIKYKNDGSGPIVDEIEQGHYSYVDGILTTDPEVATCVQSIQQQYDDFIFELEHSGGSEAAIKRFLLEESNRTNMAINDIQAEFNTWFTSMKANIDNDAAEIQDQILDIESNYVPKSMVSQVNINDSTKVPSSKVLYDLSQSYQPAGIISWGTASDSELIEALRMAYAGTIDLEEDCGWEIGDERIVQLSDIDFDGTHGDVQIVTLILMDKNVFSLSDNSGKCKYVVGVKEPLNVGANKYTQSHSSSDQYPEWNDQNNALYRLLNESVYRFPSYIQSIMKEFKAPFVCGPSDSTIHYYNQRLSVPSVYELFGENDGVVIESNEFNTGCAGSEMYSLHVAGYTDFSRFFKQFEYYRTAARRSFTPSNSYGPLRSNGIFRNGTTNLTVKDANRSSYGSFSGINGDYVLPFFVI